MCMCVCAVSIVKSVMLSTSIMEGAGTLENFITIFRDGESEVPLLFHIEVDVDTGVAAMEGILNNTVWLCFCK